MAFADLLKNLPNGQGAPWQAGGDPSRSALLAQMQGPDESGQSGDMAMPKLPNEHMNGMPPPVVDPVAPPPESGVPSPESPVTPLEHKYAGNIQGAFNPDKLKWDDPNFAKYASHPKYQFADMARDYEDTPAGLEQMSKDPRFAKANFAYLGKDKIRMPNGSVIDVGPAFSEGGHRGYNWNPISGPDAAESIAADAQGSGGSMAGGDLGGSSLLASLNSGMPTDGSFFQKLLDRARELSGPASTSRNALLSLMG